MARALLKRPRLVLLDECAASVDAHIARQVQELLHTHLADSSIIEVRLGPTDCFASKSSQGPALSMHKDVESGDYWHASPGYAEMHLNEGHARTLLWHLRPLCGPPSWILAARGRL